MSDAKFNSFRRLSWPRGFSAVGPVGDFLSVEDAIVKSGRHTRPSRGWGGIHNFRDPLVLNEKHHHVIRDG